MRIICLSLILSLAAYAQGPDSFAGAPNANLPAERVGPNDLVWLTVYGSPELTRTIRVGATGDIRLPMLKGPIRAAGRYPSELETAIAGALEAGEILVDPVVTVTIAEYSSRPVKVAGAVRNPLTFQAMGAVTLLDAITRAGGLAEDAGAEILITEIGTDETDGKQTALTRRIPVESLLAGDNPEFNPQLTGGEEIRVLDLGQVYVVGNVKKPGVYPVNSNGRTTVLEMLAMSEGLARFTNKQGFIYRRADAGAPAEIPIEIHQILKRETADVELLPNDILYIPENPSKRMRAGVLEKVLLFGSTAGATALIYGLR